MNVNDIAVPDIYKESQDFRFFCNWFNCMLTKLQYDTENLFDLYDPLRCPKQLLWLLADTMGFKLDDRLPISFNRLVLMYFMSMIYNRGSIDGITIAAETNLAQFNLLELGKQRDILYNRLEDTSIPVNSVYVSAHPADGYIDLVYFSSSLPIDACVEYVRPVGMFLFAHAGVRVDAKTKISIDVRLADERDIGVSFGPTHVGHYRREDYARQQKDMDHVRHAAWYRNSEYEDITNGDGSYGSGTNPDINPGYRALHSLQLANNEHIVKSLIDPIFSLGYDPQDISITVPDDYLNHPDDKQWNLRYNVELDRESTQKNASGDMDVYVSDEPPSENRVTPTPSVNPIKSE